MNQKTLLVILDGWGYGQIKASDAIQQANTPFMDSLHERYPHSYLTTFGELVGLPEGQMGNSEVGHLNIGAGRIVFQELARINNAIHDKSFFENVVFKKMVSEGQAEQKKIHIMGLLSDGGVHSHIDHLLAICDYLEGINYPYYYIHAFMDGRDTDPKSGAKYLEKLQQFLKHKKGRLSTIIGRYFAMDRDKRWERVRLAYDLLVHGKGETTTDPVQLLKTRYEVGETDEFLQPIVCVDSNNQPYPPIEEGDIVLFFNFRTDRPRQITEVLTQNDFPEYGMEKLNVQMVTMTRYDDTFENIEVLYEKDLLPNTLGAVLSDRGLSQLRVAETEKYPHVTYFFSGGKEIVFPLEKRIVVPSPKVATYDLKPEMSAIEVTDAAVEEIESKSPDFICLNYANTDMVGHTGDFQAAIKAAETVDSCLQRLVSKANNAEYTTLIIADHGNSDYLINEDGSPNTAHTKNPVPCILVSEQVGLERIQLRDGKLADIAPTILEIMEIPLPKEMTGRSLIVR